MTVSLPLLLFLTFVAFGLINFAISVAILRQLIRSGIKVGFFEIRWQVHRHLKTYKELGIARTGKVPPLYYAYWITLVGLLCAAVLTLASLPSS